MLRSVEWWIIWMCKKKNRMNNFVFESVRRSEAVCDILWRKMKKRFALIISNVLRRFVSFCTHKRLTGIYFYNFHPIYKVDVLGTVVYKREREKFFCYGGNVAVHFLKPNYTYNSWQALYQLCTDVNNKCGCCTMAVSADQWCHWEHLSICDNISVFVFQA